MGKFRVSTSLKTALLHRARMHAKAMLKCIDSHIFRYNNHYIDNIFYHNQIFRSSRRSVDVVNLKKMRRKSRLKSRKSIAAVSLDFRQRRVADIVAAANASGLWDFHGNICNSGSENITINDNINVTNRNGNGNSSLPPSLRKLQTLPLNQWSLDVTLCSNSEITRLNKRVCK